jgi:hypothetical protein
MLPATLLLAQAVTQEPIYGRLRLLEPAKAGEYIKFEFSFRNRTSQDIHFVKGIQPQYLVHDASGVRYEHIVLIGCRFSPYTKADLGKLPRTETYSFRTSQMSIGKPGTYRVRAFAQLGGWSDIEGIPLWKGQIWTNELTIRVGPALKKPSSR